MMSPSSPPMNAGTHKPVHELPFTIGINTATPVHTPVSAARDNSLPTQSIPITQTHSSRPMVWASAFAGVQASFMTTVRVADA